MYFCCSKTNVSICNLIFFVLLEKIKTDSNSFIFLHKIKKFNQVHITLERRKSMKLYHVSYDRIENFVLRIPKNRLPMEDSTTPRICLSTSIERCVNAKPCQGEALYFARQQGLRVAFYVYEFDTEQIPAENLIPPKMLQEHYGVLDAEKNKEYWIVENIVPTRKFGMNVSAGSSGSQITNPSLHKHYGWIYR